MIENVKWLFFYVGSTLMNEEKAYEHRMRGIAEAAKEPFDKIYEIANQSSGTKERLARHGFMQYIDLVVASE